jgi:hypothetical protein
VPNELLLELNQFMDSGGIHSNPPEEKLYEFLQELSAEGKLFDYSEQDWIEAGRAYEMADDDIASWIETAASWLDDTTEGGQEEPEQAFWTSGGQPRQNPAVKYGKGTEIEDCACEESCTCDPCPCDKCDGCDWDLCCCTCEEPEEDEDDDYDGPEEE